MYIFHKNSDNIYTGSLEGFLIKKIFMAVVERI